MNVKDLKKAIKGLPDETRVLIFDHYQEEWDSPPIAKVAVITPPISKRESPLKEQFVVFYKNPNKKYYHSFPCPTADKETPGKALVIAWRPGECP